MQPQLLESASVFLVRDVQVSAGYYRDALGFEPGPFFGDPPDFCMVWRDGHCLMLSQPADPRAVRPVSSVVPAVWDAYFWVRDVQALFAEFRERAAHIDYEPFEKPYGVHEGVVRDLDGYQLAFAQRLA